MWFLPLLWCIRSNWIESNTKPITIIPIEHLSVHLEKHFSSSCHHDIISTSRSYYMPGPVRSLVQRIFPHVPHVTFRIIRCKITVSGSETYNFITMPWFSFRSLRAFLRVFMRAFSWMLTIYYRWLLWCCLACSGPCCRCSVECS